jgi:asparagine synthase (glutamine-hydrolysing)
MCGIAGLISLEGRSLSILDAALRTMNRLQAHRGPDGEGTWTHPTKRVGLAHRRLAIIDLEHGQQPMIDSRTGDALSYNGEIYNFIELRDELRGQGCSFTTTSDTEVLLQAYRVWGRGCLDKLRGMYSFAMWDNRTGELLLVRDRFGVKPLYYAQVSTPDGQALAFASEAKAILPLLPDVKTDKEGLRDYLTFQFCLGGKTLFEGVNELPPGHLLRVSASGKFSVERYWEVYYNLDWDHRAPYFEREIRELVEESVRLHLRADVPVGAYLSGGFDSSVIASVASGMKPDGFMAFTGRFTEGPAYDESHYARAVAEQSGFPIHVRDIGVQDFIENISDVIYHLDYPTAGPGSFPQYMVSELASRHRKVVMGGQGGDEIFGGYTRYLIAYFEQCIKAAIDGTSGNGNFVVTYESIIPNLTSLRGYKPLLKQFWAEGLFEDLDRRYFRLISRAPTIGEEIRWDELGDYEPYDTFRSIFRAGNVGQESYFDSMTHFDFKTLLPALLQVEDRVSMAHGLESRVPLLDHRIVEFAAKVPADVKFKNGSLKHLFRQSLGDVLPDAVLNRKDKMGFPVPLTEWIQGAAKGFVHDVLGTKAAASRPFIDNKRVIEELGRETQFGRKVWGLLSLELWQQAFHDKGHEFRAMLQAELAKPSVPAGSTANGHHISIRPEIKVLSSDSSKLEVRT